MDIVIRCLGCQATYAQGGLDPSLTDEQVLAQARHNPGCAINRPGMRTRVHTEEVSSKIVYTVLVFPAYQEG